MSPRLVFVWVGLRWRGVRRRLKAHMEIGWVQGVMTGLEAAAGLGLVAGGAAYAAMWPGSQIYGRTQIAPRRPGELALTFDDGPNPAWTPQLLEVLASHGAKATFFLVGRYAAAQPELVKRVRAAGHEVGTHSWSHLNLAVTSAARIREELARTCGALEDATGERVRLFRPPFGARRPAVLRIARELGMRPVMWNAMTTDWELRSAETIAERLGKKISQLEQQGWAANIVLHDGAHNEMAADRGPSVAAAGRLLERFKGSHRFVTVGEWV